MFDISKIEKKLKIKKIGFFETIDSTNKIAMDIAKNENNECIIIALLQTKGKGRFNRKWISPKGGIYFSYILPYNSILIPLQLTTIASAMAIIEYLKNKNFENIIYRWPNDILINNKKISGILLELVNNTVIIGIGINVNIEKFDNSLNSIATSMYNEMKRKFVLEETVIEIIENIRKFINDRIYIDKFLKNNSMIGKNVKIKTVSKEFIGNVKEFSENGEIIIDINGGSKKFIAGDIEILRIKK